MTCKRTVFSSADQNIRRWSNGGVWKLKILILYSTGDLSCHHSRSKEGMIHGNQRANTRARFVGSSWAHRSTARRTVRQQNRVFADFQNALIVAQSELNSRFFQSKILLSRRSRDDLGNHRELVWRRINTAFAFLCPTKYGTNTRVYYLFILIQVQHHDHTISVLRDTQSIDLRARCVQSYLAHSSFACAWYVVVRTIKALQPMHGRSVYSLSPSSYT